MSDDTQQAYSLQNLKDWVNDAIQSECTPKEIYDSIIDTVKNSRKYHKVCYDDGTKLLSLLRGHPEGITVVGDPEGVTTLSDTGYYTSDMFNLTSPCLGEGALSDPTCPEDVVISGEWPNYSAIDLKDPETELSEKK